MSLAELLVQVRLRAGAVPRSDSVEQAIATLTGLACMPGPQGEALRRLMAGLAEPATLPEFAFRELAVIGPLAAGSLDCLIEAILEGRCSAEHLRDTFGPGLSS